MISIKSAKNLFSISALGPILLVKIEETIDDEGIKNLTETLSESIVKYKSKAVIIDLANVDILDSYLASHLESLAYTTKLLQAEVIISGLKGPTIITLLEFDIKIEGVNFALDVNHALDQLS